jgi:hypothetical protein
MCGCTSLLRPQHPAPDPLGRYRRIQRRGRSFRRSPMWRNTFAYSMWRMETQKHFGLTNTDSHALSPVIVLDTAEVLAGQDTTGGNVHTTTTKPYTTLEAFCLAVPVDHGIFAIGCNSGIERTDLILTGANITNIPPLAIPLGSLDEAENAWGIRTDKAVRDALYHICGGIPRLLRLTHEVGTAMVGHVSLATGSWMLFADLFQHFQMKCNASYFLSDAKLTVAYSCLLVAATRTLVAAGHCARTA